MSKHIRSQSSNHRAFLVMIFCGALSASTPAWADVFGQGGTQKTWGYSPDSNGSGYVPYYENGRQQASSPSRDKASLAQNDWDVTLGLGMGFAPKYLGSKGYNVTPLPMVSVVYQQTFFLNTNGVGMNAINWNGLKAGPLLGFDMGRRHTDSTSRLNGMDNIQPALDAGGFVSFDYVPLTVGGNLQQAVTETKYGFTSRLHAGYKQPLIPGKLEFEAGPEIDFGSDDYMRTWFGVSNYESARSGLGQHSADGGVRDVGLSATLGYHYTQHILVPEAVGKSLGVPVVAMSTDKAKEHFGWLMTFVDKDMSASSTNTRQKLGWNPKGPGLLDDLARLELAAA